MNNDITRPIFLPNLKKIELGYSLSVVTLRWRFGTVQKEIWSTLDFEAGYGSPGEMDSGYMSF